METIYADSPDITTNPVNYIKISESLDMVGIGGFCGASFHTAFCGSIGFYARCTAGFSYARFESELEEAFFMDGALGTTPVPNPYLDAKGKFWQIIGECDTSVGLTCILCDACGSQSYIRVGWDFCQYHCMPDFYHLLDERVGVLNRNLSALGMEGFFAKLAVIF